jgi:ABC-type antimicrobial peptide transport system permease subunit
VNRTLAARYFADEDPVGKQILILTTPPLPIQIVGVLDDIREGPLDAPIPPVLYFPFAQSPDTDFTLVVRTSQAERSLLPVLAATIRQSDPGIAPVDGMTLSDRISDSQSAYLRRSVVCLVGGFAALSLLLSVVGLYSVVAYSVGRRTREFAIRVALGALPGSIFQLILMEAGRLIAFGVVVGLGCSVGVATLMRGLLFGVGPWDVPTLTAAAGVLGASALLASFIPARRATRVDPMVALRYE